MNNLLLPLVFIGLLILSSVASAQNVYALIGDENDNHSVAQYTHSTNNLSNTSSLPILSGFYSETAAFDEPNDQIIVADDNGIQAIQITNGNIVSQPFPFAATNGFELSLHYHPTTQIIYALIGDENGNYSVAQYDHATNTLSNSNALAALNGFYSETATLDAANNQILAADDNGIKAINVLNGTITNQPFPFTATNGFELSLHYHVATQVVYALIGDENGNYSVAQYDHATNTLSNSNALAALNGFYSETATLDAANNQILVADDNGIKAINVLNGTITNQPFPFAATNGYNLSLHFRQASIMSSLRQTAVRPNIQLYPNPAQEVLMISSWENFEQVEILDVLGNSLFLTQERSTKLRVSSLSPGLYWIRFSNTEATFSKPFVKK